MANIVDFANQVKSYAMSNNEQKLTGAYNLLSPFDYPATQTSAGVKWTNNGDRTISSSNTATANSLFTLVDNQKLGPTGTYLLRGCPAGGGLYKYFLRVRDVTAGVNYDEYGDGIQIDIDDTHYYNVVFGVIGGETAPTGLWKPMILTAMTNRELTEYVSKGTWQNATINTTNVSSGTVKYCIKCGICFVEMMNVKVKNVGNTQSIATGLPKPYGFICGMSIAGDYTSAPLGNGFYISDNSDTLNAHIKTAGIDNFISFAYIIR